MYKRYILCFTMVDLKKDRYQRECVDTKNMSDKRCSDLQSYIKRCGVVTAFDVKVKPSGKVLVDTKNVKVSDGSPDVKSDLMVNSGV